MRLNTLVLSILIVLSICVGTYAQTDTSDTNAAFKKAWMFCGDGVYDSCRVYYRQAMDIYQAEENGPLYFRSSVNHAYAHLDDSRYDDAITLCRDASEQHFSEPMGATGIELAYIYLAMGNTYFEMGRFDATIEIVSEGLALIDTIANQESAREVRIKALNNLGYAYSKNNQPGKALQILEVVLVEKEAFYGKDHDLTLNAHRNIADSYFGLGYLDKALAIQLYVLEVEKQNEEWNGVAYCYYDIAKIYQRKRDYQSSHEYILQAMEYFQKAYGINHRWTGHCYHQIGNVYETAKDYEESIIWYTKAYDHYNQLLGVPNSNAPLSLLNIAKAYQFMGDHEKSIKTYKEVWGLFDKVYATDHGRYMELWLSMGNCYFDMGDMDNARNLFLRSYRRAFAQEPEKSYWRALSALNLAKATEDHDSSLLLFQESLWELSNGFEYTDYRSNPEVFEIFYDHWTLQALKYKSDRLQYKYSEEGDLEDLRTALKIYVRASELIDDSRARFFTESAKTDLARDAREVYAGAVDVCFTLYEATGFEAFLEQAFYMMEKSRGLVLLDAVLSDQAIRLGRVPDSTSMAYESVKQEITRIRGQLEGTADESLKEDLTKQLLDHRTDLRELQTHIDETYPEMAELSKDATPIGIYEIQYQLDDEETLLEYLMTDANIYCMVIDKGKINFFKNTLDSNHISTLESFINEVQDHGWAVDRGSSMEAADNFYMGAKSLYDWLLHDAALVPGNSIIIIPDAKLNYLPFELLVSSGSDTESKIRKYPFVLRDHPVRYHFSSTLHFNQGADRRQDRGSLIAFAPEYEGSSNEVLATRGGFTSLMHTAEEATTIGSLFDGAVYLAKDATESRFKQEVYKGDILHLAMHAYTDEEAPMRSGLIFTENDDTEDDVVHAYELYNMDINANLVVLSACNTGGGAYKHGEGVMSLARAFRQAGAPNIVMSLWQADDEATREVMESFYTYLDSGLPKDKALQKAKLDYLDTGKRAYPHFWGAFVLMGDAAPISGRGPIAPRQILFIVFGLALIVAGVYLSRRRKRTSR